MRQYLIILVNRLIIISKYRKLRINFNNNHYNKVSNKEYKEYNLEIKYKKYNFLWMKWMLMIMNHQSVLSIN